MKILSDCKATHKCIQHYRSAQDTIALVPTMGNLHAGHLSLIEIAKTHATRVIVSIFVNPTQFNQVSDFERYPRTLEDDLKKLKSLNIDIAFTPSQNDLYPNGTSQPAKIIIPDLTEVLEGHYRPGHFEGVCTVVCKLFNIINPDIAVFGRKDYQQLLIIRRMVEDLNFKIKILAGDTQREDDGLAMSSRNSHLNDDQRQLAAHIFNVLTQTKDHFSTNVAALEQTAVSSLTQMGFNVEYFAIRDANNLQDISQHTENIVVLVAAWLGDIRLIDNLLFPMP